MFTLCRMALASARKLYREGLRSHTRTVISVTEPRGVLPILGSFSIDDGNGSENVSYKMNSGFFSLCRVYSNLLKMASVGEFPWS